MSGKTLLWVRSLDSLDVRPLTGTEGARGPFWSTDSRWIGFFAAGKLAKVAASGGAPELLCDAPQTAYAGGTWGPDGTIVFAAGFVGLSRVSSAGADRSALANVSPGEAAHRFPFFLPDGRHFLYQQGSAIFVTALDSPTSQRLLAADSGAIYAPPGYLLFVRQGDALRTTV